MIYERRGHDHGVDLYTFVMMTTLANRRIREGNVNDRMPAPEMWDVWLGEADASIEEAKALVVPVDGDWTMEAKTQKPKPTKPTSDNRQFNLF